MSNLVNSFYSLSLSLFSFLLGMVKCFVVVIESTGMYQEVQQHFFGRDGAGSDVTPIPYLSQLQNTAAQSDKLRVLHNPLSGYYLHT